MCVLTYLINYLVLLQSVTGHGSYIKHTGNTSLPVSFQKLVLHTPVNLLRERKREKERERERGGGRERGRERGGLSMKKDIDLRRESQWLPRVSSCSVLYSFSQ